MKSARMGFFLTEKGKVSDDTFIPPDTFSGMKRAHRTLLQGRNRRIDAAVKERVPGRFLSRTRLNFGSVDEVA